MGGHLKGHSVRREIVQPYSGTYINKRDFRSQGVDGMRKVLIEEPDDECGDINDAAVASIVC